MRHRAPSEGSRWDIESPGLAWPGLEANPVGHRVPWPGLEANPGLGWRRTLAWAGGEPIPGLGANPVGHPVPWRRSGGGNVAGMPPRTLGPEGEAAVAEVAGYLDRGEEPPAAALRMAVRQSLQMLAGIAPGRSVEVRVPPVAAVQCVEGPRHTRGTPPNVIEADPLTWFRLATGRLGWAEAVESGTVRASGPRADLSAYLPVCKRLPAYRLGWTAVTCVTGNARSPQRLAAHGHPQRGVGGAAAPPLGGRSMATAHPVEGV